jgi:hypothetical protein
MFREHPDFGIFRVAFAVGIGLYGWRTYATGEPPLVSDISSDSKTGGCRSCCTDDGQCDFDLPEPEKPIFDPGTHFSNGIFSAASKIVKDLRMNAASGQQKRGIYIFNAKDGRGRVNKFIFLLDYGPVRTSPDPEAEVLYQPILHFIFEK